MERTQDFTDSAYTSHEHRQAIVILSDRVKMELASLLRVQGVSTHLQDQEEGHLDPEGTTLAIRAVVGSAAELRGELSQTAVEHTKFLADHARCRLVVVVVVVVGRWRGGWWPYSTFYWHNCPKIQSIKVVFSVTKNLVLFVSFLFNAFAPILCFSEQK